MVVVVANVMGHVHVVVDVQVQVVVKVHVVVVARVHVAFRFLCKK